MIESIKSKTIWPSTTSAFRIHRCWYRPCAKTKVLDRSAVC